MPSRPGVVTVARAAGVSASTVSNVFNRPHVVRPELRERVLRAAAELGYGGPDPAARSLRSGRASALGLVIRERLAHAFEDTATVRVLQGVSDAADPHHLGLVIVPAYPEEGTTDGPAVRQAAVDGLILYSLAGDDPLIDAARRRHLPIVVIDSPAGPDAPGADEFPFVGIDEQAAGEAALRHLLDLGHRRLGILSLRLSARDEPGFADTGAQERATASVPKGRLEGAARALAAAGVAWEDVAVVQRRISSVEHGRTGAHALLDAAPETTAVFALSDALALGARLAARERGLSVPADLSIVGFDDSASETEGLTTIHQPLREKGRIATERLLLALAGEAPAERRRLLPTRLVVRGSTAAR
jgi:DNA-binding LacI/PurR family transcriptional regulator